MHPAQYEGAATLNRQCLDDCLQPAQFVAGFELRHRACIGCDQIYFTELLEPDHLFPASLVDHQVARDLKEVGASLSDPLEIDGRVGPHHRLGDQIVDSGVTRQQPS